MSIAWYVVAGVSLVLSGGMALFHWKVGSISLLAVAIAACAPSDTEWTEEGQGAEPDEPLGDPGIAFDAARGAVTITGSSGDDIASVTSLSPSSLRVTLGALSADYAATSVTEIVFHGGAGDDVFTNATGIKCTVHGGGGDDTLLGGGGDDLLHGGEGDDEIHGGEGRDRLFGGSGNDMLFGGAGQDVIVAIGGGMDTITGGADLDYIWMDTTDILTDEAPDERALGYVHEVGAFFSVSYDGGKTSRPIGKELKGEDLPDPRHHPDHRGLSLHRFAENPLFAAGGPSEDDIFQGSIGDCYFLAPLSATADADPEAIRRLVADLGDGTYAVRFHRGGQAQYVRVDADLWIDAGSGVPKYARLGQEGSLWVPIVEKAYAFFRRQRGSYPSIGGGDQTLQDHLRGTKTVWSIDDGVTAASVVAWFASGSPDGPMKDTIHAGVVDLLEWIQAQHDNGEALYTGAVTGVGDETAINERTYRRGQHLYMIDHVQADSSGNPSGLVLRDPYGLLRTLTDFTRIYYCVGRAVIWRM